ncbi:multidrug transporter subunit MdtN [Erwinia sp. DT-104]|jgi:multidrug efflux system membrane fusion protein|uniref:multidrug transporter subunit MdtN n=1 Tax=Erwinia sp. DT-104 TaxID=3396161 RepID=UPI003F1B17F2
MPIKVKTCMNKRLFILVLSVSTLAILIWLIRLFDETPGTDDAYVYADTINIAPQVNGVIIKIPVKENELVHKGDVLFEIDPRPYHDALIREKANLAQLEQQVILTRRDISAQEFNAQATEKHIDAARATAEQDAATLRRLQALRARNYVSDESLDQAQARQRASAAQLQSARLQAEQANAAVSSVSALIAKREVIKADISIAEFNLEHTVVRAPFDGRITSLKTTGGQYVSTGQAVFTLVDSRNWYVVANYRESELKNIHDGDSADVYLMSDTGKHFTGSVESTGYGVYPDDGGAIQSGLPSIARNINWVRVAQRFPVRIRITTPDSRLFRMGTSAVVKVHSGSQSDEKNGHAV